MQTLTLNNATWTKIGDSIDAIILQCNCPGVRLYISDAVTIPVTASEPGFSLPSGVPVALSNLLHFGGSLWAYAGSLAPASGGIITYAI